MIPVSEISKRLSDRVLEVCKLLLPGGEVEGDTYCCGDIDGGEGKSLKVHLNGGHPGHWKDWAGPDDHHGDLLDLWRIKKSLSPGDAIQEAKTFLGIHEPKPAQKKVYPKAPKRDYREPAREGGAMQWFLKKRCIPENIVQAYKISLREDSNGDRWVVFPSYSPTGELINRSYRSFPNPKNPDEPKRVEQDKGCAPSLFGWHALSQEAYETKTIIICEGQIDAMSWATWGFPVLSIPNGSGMKWVDYEWENLEMFEVIYIAFDSDDKGRQMRRDAVQRLGAHRCMIIELPHKDANECLQKGIDAKDAAKWIANAKNPEFDGIIRGNELESRIRAGLADKEMPFTLKIFDVDWKFQKGLYFRPRDVTLWTGLSNAGKSTLLNWIQLVAVCQSRPVYICSLEVRAEDTARKIAHACLASDGHPRTDENIVDWLKLLGDKIILCDIVGMIKQDVLMNQMKFAFQRFGVKQFFIDSLMRIEGLEENYPAQGDFLGKLQEFSKNTGTHVHLVSHPGKVKDRRVAIQDIKGSVLLGQNADNVVVVSRNPEKYAAEQEYEQLTDEQNKMHDMEVTVEKQRNGGWIGTFYLKFNRFDLTFGLTQKYSPPKPDKKSYRKKDWNSDRY